MYFPYFVTYILVGFTISGLVLVWALKNGQFREQDRARFLPLEADSSRPAVCAGFSRLETYALMSLACAGLLASGAAVVFALVKG